MMKDVLINIKGTQGLDNDTDVIEFTTLGKFGKKGASFLMTYDEGEMIGVKGVKSTLHIKDNNMVILQRSGGTGNRLTVQKGVRNTCFYSTEYGDMAIGVFGKSLKNDLSEHGGHFKMSYTIDSNLQLISHNVVEISIEEVNQNVTTCS